MLGVSIDTLRRWDKNATLRAMRSPGGHRYYSREEIERYSADIFSLARVWAESIVAQDLPSEQYCESQDRFRARLDTMAVLLDRNEHTKDLAPLLVAVAGEIGNNSFDHNIGNWPDVPGIFYSYDLNKRVIVMADRGLGIRATLSRIRPGLEDDIQALTVAMTERLSGRAPERRGNGLKFVREVMENYPISVSLQSGIAVAEKLKIGGKLRISLANRNLRELYKDNLLICA